jgi:hypothetical protein
MKQTTCTIDGCAKPAVARGWCSGHYQRWRRNGDPLLDRSLKRRRCKVDGCDRWSHGYSMCHGHYMMWRRHGDPEWVRPTYEVCTVEGCDKQPRSKTAELCEMHYARLRRVGSLELDRWYVERPAYRTAHARVASDRGKAKEHQCIDCDRQAAHWSFAWRDVDHTAWLWEMCNGSMLAYTGEPNHYEPRCAKCARHYDMDFGSEGWRLLGQQAGA